MEIDFKFDKVKDSLDDFNVIINDKIVGTMFRNKNIKGEIVSYTVRSGERTSIQPDEAEVIRWLVNKVEVLNKD